MREWGYASYDMDDGRLTYTSYESNGSVNKFHDNGDGGHSHQHWNNVDDYNLGKDPDWLRMESNDKENPEIADIEEHDGCYLTTAVMKHMLDKFDDNCYYLDMLRWFRDNYVSKEDKMHYYEIAPKVVESINKLENANKIYEDIYKKVIQVCVRLIEIGKYDIVYDLYKNSVLNLENTYVKKLVLD